MTPRKNFSVAPKNRSVNSQIPEMKNRTWKEYPNCLIETYRVSSVKYILCSSSHPSSIGCVWPYELPASTEHRQQCLSHFQSDVHDRMT